MVNCMLISIYKWMQNHHFWLRKSLSCKCWGQKRQIRSYHLMFANSCALHLAPTFGQHRGQDARLNKPLIWSSRVFLKLWKKSQIYWLNSSRHPCQFCCVGLIGLYRDPRCHSWRAHLTEDGSYTHFQSALSAVLCHFRTLYRWNFWS